LETKIGEDMLDELIKIRKYIDEVIETYKDLHPDEEENQKQQALKKLREGIYESTFRKKQRQKTAESSEGPPSLCVYGDS
tara:strand:- start:6339 stop:6578 length:240 start_codon:yes stop_codon:yes gene_type:complete